MQVAIATLALEYERQKGKDLARAAKEKAFADKCEHEHQVRHPGVTISPGANKLITSVRRFLHWKLY